MSGPPHLVIVNDASTARGGATGLALRSARLLRERGWPVTFVCGDDGANPDLAEWGVDVVALGERPLLARGSGDAILSGIHNSGAKAMVAALRERLDGSNVVWHLHGWSKILSPAVIAALAPVAKRTVLHAHDYFLACPNGAFMEYPAERPCERTPLSVRCLAARCDKRSRAQKAWRVARQAAANRALRLGGTWASLAMIHEAMEPRLQTPALAATPKRTVRNPAEPLTKERVRAEENDTFLFIGRVEREKGVDALCLAARMAGVRLRVAGEGPLLSSLREAFREVRFDGWCDRSALSEALREARALVMPSRYPEPFGLVAAEASLSGVPVIASSTALLAPEIERGGIGRTCDPADAAALAQTLKHVAGLDRRAIETMSRRAYGREVALCHSDASWADALEALYEDVLGAASPSAPSPASSLVHEAP